MHHHTQRKEGVELVFASMNWSLLVLQTPRIKSFIYSKSHAYHLVPDYDIDVCTLLYRSEAMRVRRYINTRNSNHAVRDESMAPMLWWWTTLTTAEDIFPHAYLEVPILFCQTYTHQAELDDHLSTEHTTNTCRSEEWCTAIFLQSRYQYTNAINIWSNVVFNQRVETSDI